MYHLTCCCGDSSCKMGPFGSDKPHRRGSTGSLSRASTPKTHSRTRRSGSQRTNRSSVMEVSCWTDVP